MSDDLTIAYMLGVEDMRSKLHKQADEIERLRAENETLRRDVKTAVMGDSAELADVKRENEKLREALKRAADRDEERRKPICLVGSEAADKIYVVIEEDRGLGPMGLGVFKSAEEADVFVKNTGNCWVEKHVFEGKHND